MAKAMGVITINVIGKTNMGDFEDAASLVKGMGGDIVVSESYLRSGKYDALISDFPAPKLGFSAAGGATAGNVVRSLSSGKVIVYGAKSADPIVVPAESKVAVEGFWLDDKSADERVEIISKVADQELHIWYECNGMDEFPNAIDDAVNGWGVRTPMLRMVDRPLASLERDENGDLEYQSYEVFLAKAEAEEAAYWAKKRAELLETCPHLDEKLALKEVAEILAKLQDDDEKRADKIVADRSAAKILADRR
jgi:hypothetical protein